MDFIWSVNIYRLCSSIFSFPLIRNMNVCVLLRGFFFLNKAESNVRRCRKLVFPSPSGGSIFLMMSLFTIKARYVFPSPSGGSIFLIEHGWDDWDWEKLFPSPSGISIFLIIRQTVRYTTYMPEFPSPSGGSIFLMENTSIIQLY